MSPVRALRIYLKRMKGLSRCSLALFLSPRCRTRTISKIAISFFLREVISGVGTVRGSEVQTLRTHSIGGISASAAFMRNQSVSKVLESATWRSNSVFSSFYFEDFLYFFRGMEIIGTVCDCGVCNLSLIFVRFR